MPLTCEHCGVAEINCHCDTGHYERNMETIINETLESLDCVNDDLATCEDDVMKSRLLDLRFTLDLAIGMMRGQFPEYFDQPEA